MKNKIMGLILKLGVKKIAIIGAITVIAIVGMVVGVSALKPANEIVEEDKNKDKDYDSDKDEIDEKNEDTETKEDVAEETVAEEEATEEQTETIEGTTPTTTGNTNSNSTTNNTTTTTPSNNTSNSNTNNNSSANQNTQTQTPTTTPVNTWFDKRGFKLTTVTSTFCLCNVDGHDCDGDFQISSTTENCTVGMKRVSFLANCVCECFDEYSWALFDKYTGTLLFWPLDEGEYATFNCNGKDIKFCSYTYAYWNKNGMEIECSEDYDGMIFVYYPWNRIKECSLEGLYTVDKGIDFSGNDCYFFSYGNK